MSLKKLLLSLTMAGCAAPAFAQTQNARVQVIHNCADAIADSVDVYVNGNLALDNFAFRTATPFINLPAGVPLNIGVAPKNSSAVTDTIYNMAATLTANGTYVVVASGIVSPTGYSPAQPFDLKVYPMGQEAAANSGNTDVLVMHGSTDAPVVDVRSGGNTLVDNIGFGQFSNGYLQLPTADYTIRITNSTGSTTVQTYAAPLQSLGLQGSALTVVASGFLNPAANSNGPALGLYVALPTGGALIPLPTAAPEKLARLQIVHNSADAVADSVDVYVNTILLLDNFAFRTATPFIDVPAGVALNIAVAPKNSTSAQSAVYTVTATLDSAKKYIAVANGIVSATGYTPAQAFGLNIYDMAREEATNSANTDVLVIHGSTDAPTVDVRAGATVLVDDIAYGQFSNGYLSLPTNNYNIDITDATGATTVQTYAAPLQTLGLQGAALTVVASGFLNPGNNSNGAGFGLWVALPTGGSLIPLPIVNNIGGVDANKNMRIFPNPATNNLFITGIDQPTTLLITDLSGRTLITRAINQNETVDVSALSSGIYLLKAGEKGTTVKFVKQ